MLGGYPKNLNLRPNQPYGPMIRPGYADQLMPLGGAPGTPVQGAGEAAQAGGAVSSMAGGEGGGGGEAGQPGGFEGFMNTNRVALSGILAGLGSRALGRKRHGPAVQQAMKIQQQMVQQQQQQKQMQMRQQEAKRQQDQHKLTMMAGEYALVKNMGGNKKALDGKRDEILMALGMEPSLSNVSAIDKWGWIPNVLAGGGFEDVKPSEIVEFYQFAQENPTFADSPMGKALLGAMGTNMKEAQQLTSDVDRVGTIGAANRKLEEDNFEGIKNRRVEMDTALRQAGHDFTVTNHQAMMDMKLEEIVQFRDAEAATAGANAKAIQKARNDADDTGLAAAIETDVDSFVATYTTAFGKAPDEKIVESYRTLASNEDVTARSQFRSMFLKSLNPEAADDFLFQAQWKVFNNALFSEGGSRVRTQIGTEVQQVMAALNEQRADDKLPLLEPGTSEFDSAITNMIMGLAEKPVDRGGGGSLEQAPQILRGLSPGHQMQAVNKLTNWLLNDIYGVEGQERPNLAESLGFDLGSGGGGSNNLFQSADSANTAQGGNEEGIETNSFNSLVNGF